MDDMMAQLGDTFGSMLQTEQGPPAHKRAKEAAQGTSKTSSSDHVIQAIQLLTALTLRQEGYLQSVQTMDTFLLFLQFAPAGIVPHLMKKTQEWKKAMEARMATTALKTLLFQTVVQTVQDRFLRVAQSRAGSEIWNKATCRACRAWWTSSSRSPHKANQQALTERAPNEIGP